MIFGVKGTSQVEAPQYKLKIRCPGCGRDGTFDDLSVKDIQFLHNERTHRTGIRRCPNEHCATLVMYVARGSDLVWTTPSSRLDFNKEGIPDQVLKAFIEAIDCHANQCYTASAMMIRKTLELLCADQSAAGDNLIDRLHALESKVILPPVLFNGMHQLRLFGNDAAHIEMRTYDNIGKDEVELAIEFTKEILKAVYQLQQLLERLKNSGKTETNETPPGSGAATGGRPAMGSRS